MPFSGAGLSELDLVQNPGFGAYLLWHFTLGYQEDGAETAPFLLGFLVLPILLHRPTLEAVATTRKGSGLILFASKFDRQRENLIALHARALALRPLSLQSVGVAATSGLVRIDYGAATLHGYTPGDLGMGKPPISERLRGFDAAANKFGQWCSKLSAEQVALILMVDF